MKRVSSLMLRNQNDIDHQVRRNEVGRYSSAVDQHKKGAHHHKFEGNLKHRIKPNNNFESKRGKSQKVKLKTMIQTAGPYHYTNDYKLFVVPSVMPIISRIVEHSSRLFVYFLCIFKYKILSLIPFMPMPVVIFSLQQ